MKKKYIAPFLYARKISKPTILSGSDKQTTSFSFTSDDGNGNTVSTIDFSGGEYNTDSGNYHTSNPGGF